MWNLFLSHKHKTLSPGVSFLSTIPMCATHTPLIQRCLSLLRYENLRLFLFNISFSHTNTNSVSQGLISLHHFLVCHSHTLSLSLEISCVPSYVSLAITLVVKYLSLSQTQNSVSLDLISLCYLFVCDSHAPSLYLSHTHTHTQPSDPLDSYL